MATHRSFFLQAFMWQVDFAASPAVLDDLKHILKVVAATCPTSLICTSSQGFMHCSMQSYMLNDVSKSLCTVSGSIYSIACHRR